VKRFSLRACAALALAVFAAAPARAEIIPWYYSTLPLPTNVASSNGGNGHIALTGLLSGQLTGGTDVTLAYLQTVSNAPPGKPATFSAAPYQLALTILDADSKTAGTLYFTGALSGKLSAGSALITNQYTGDVKQSLVLGDHLYTVQLDKFAPPGAPGAGKGSIPARVWVTDVPEPTALALAGIGLGLFGARRWWQRRVRGGDPTC
jgi:hypothetical protein